ncbi:MAG: chemotaxis protein CheA [Spirochaetales bacterium]|nr:chemotaxis protein CheA [Spirochaetales bacterium]
MDESLLNLYFQETKEQLDKIEELLLALENDREDNDLVKEIFRHLHTIKGNSGMYGFTEVASIIHKTENIYDQLRKGQINITKEIIDFTLLLKDAILKMLKIEEAPKKAIDEDIKRILEFTKPFQIDDIILDNKSESSEEQQVDAIESTYWIRFKPPKDIYSRGLKPEKILDELKSLGECQIIEHKIKDSIITGDKIQKICLQYWDIIITINDDPGVFKDIFIFVEPISEITIKKIDDILSDENIEYKRLGEILLERGDVTENDIAKVMQHHKRLGESLVELGIIENDLIESALKEQEVVRERRKTRIEQGSQETIRVASDKLDSLVNMVGELVTIQSRIQQTAEECIDSESLSAAEHLGRIVENLRDLTMSVRMLPLSHTYNKFQRLVRDLSHELNKDVDYITQGGEVELDKSILEQINEPLIHLIRNALDHGLESPEERKKAGKNPRGTLCLSARQLGANVILTVQDDGRGMDSEKIRTKAIEKGIISETTELSCDEIFQLIFESGFSSKDTVSSISGRGVGMDAVKKAMDSIGGTVELDCKSKQGTSISLVLPLTLAIIEGMLIKLGHEKYIIPLAVVEECLDFPGSSRDDEKKSAFINVRGELLPYMALNEIFGFKNHGQAQSKYQQVVVVNISGKRIGLVVDEVVGNIQTIIKNLGRLYKDVEGISGASILGDGSVVLIMDVYALYRRSLKQGAEAGIFS